MQDLDFNPQFTQAYDLLENSLKNLFITGKAGTGKSTLLEYFRGHTLKNAVVLAPTGVAAINVKGQTIHSFFYFKPDITPDTVAFIKVRKSRRKLYETLDIIVIDEISMVRADLLDCIDAFLRLHGREKGRPFGGVQMVFFGDLYQLPPVVTSYEKDLFQIDGEEGAYATPYFFSAHSFEYLGLELVELQEVYRQKDKYFVKLLNVIRNNIMRDDHLQLLNQRCNPQFQPPEEDLFIHLTTTNAMADRINQQHLSQLDQELCCFEGDILGDFREKDLPTKQSLGLKLGAQVMMLNNDPAGQWVNGSIGKIVSLQGGYNSKEEIQVELSEGETVDVKPFTWEVFRFFLNEDTKRLESESVGSFMQYPMRLAWAVTIHKSQGKTFSKVVIDLGRGAFAHGQLYVALSRCTDFQGLILKRPVRHQDVILDKEVVQFMNRKHTPGVCLVEK